MVKTLKTTSDVIDKLGGNTAVAWLTSRSSNAVSNWRSFGKFPTPTFPLIRDELRKHGYAAPESLWAWQEPNPDIVVKRKSRAA
jgi:hypothetical protein